MTETTSTIYRTDKKFGNFTQIVNSLIIDTRLSSLAKVLLMQLLMRPDGWAFNKDEVASHFKEGRGAVERAFKELKDAGYLIITRMRRETFFVGYHWEIREPEFDKNIPQREKGSDVLREGSENSVSKNSGTTESSSCRNSTRRELDTHSNIELTKTEGINTESKNIDEELHIVLLGAEEQISDPEESFDFDFFELEDQDQGLRLGESQEPDLEASVSEELEDITQEILDQLPHLSNRERANLWYESRARKGVEIDYDAVQKVLRSGLKASNHFLPAAKFLLTRMELQEPANPEKPWEKIMLVQAALNEDLNGAYVLRDQRWWNSTEAAKKAIASCGLRGIINSLQDLSEDLTQLKFAARNINAWAHKARELGYRAEEEAEVLGLTETKEDPSADEILLAMIADTPENEREDLKARLRAKGINV